MSDKIAYPRYFRVVGGFLDRTKYVRVDSELRVRAVLTDGDEVQIGGVNSLSDCILRVNCGAWEEIDLEDKLR